MLYTLAVILLIAWVLGLVGTYTIGAFVHLLLVIALVLFIVGLLSGRRTSSERCRPRVARNQGQERSWPFPFHSRTTG